MSCTYWSGPCRCADECARLGCRDVRSIKWPIDFVMSCYEISKHIASDQRVPDVPRILLEPKQNAD